MEEPEVVMRRSSEIKKNRRSSEMKEKSSGGKNVRFAADTKGRFSSDLEEDRSSGSSDQRFSFEKCGNRSSEEEPLKMATGIPNYKIILCGEYGVGKSSIFRRFQNNTYIEHAGKKSTIGLDQSTRVFEVGEAEVKLTLWDTGGMERMSFIGSSYYRGAQAALLCYSINNKETFTILSQYILDIVMNAEGAKIFLCGNMADSSGDQEKVSETDFEAFMGECGDVLSGVYQISCKENIGIQEMFSDIANKLHEEAMSKMTIRRDMNHMVIRPGETPDRENGKKKCC